MQEYKTLMS